MSAVRSCIIRELPIPEREYRAAPPERWAKPVPPPARRRTSRAKHRQRSLLPLVLAGLALFLGGLLLGRAGAANPVEPSSLQEDSLSSEPLSSEGVRILRVPGAAVGEPEPSGSGMGDGTEDGGSWNLRLVNWENPLPEGFQPPELTALRNGHSIDSRAYPALQRMMDAARAEGLDPLICSSFRTWDKQSELFQRKVLSFSGLSQQEAEAKAALWVARPGTSEHQVGLAVDIVDKGYQLLDQGQEETPVQKWLMAHCGEYGFILRYPTDKSALTGIGYEPWHYRYVGETAAREIMSQGICLEEYLSAQS